MKANYNNALKLIIRMAENDEACFDSNATVLIRIRIKVRIRIFISACNKYNPYQSIKYIQY